MRRISFWFMSTLSALVLLFGYHTSTNAVGAAPPPTPLAPDVDSANIATAPTATTPTATTTATTTTTTTKAAAGTFTGSAVNTRWGLVQVRITVTNGKITSSQAIDYPTENRKDQQINAYAVPILNQAVVQAQSADIDSISGATVTSNGYVASLQSALDQAHL